MRVKLGRIARDEVVEGYVAGDAGVIVEREDVALVLVSIGTQKEAVGGVHVNVERGDGQGSERKTCALAARKC